MLHVPTGCYFVATFGFKCWAAITFLHLASCWQTAPAVRSGAVQSRPASPGSAGRSSSSLLFHECYTTQKSKKTPHFTTFIWALQCWVLLKLTAWMAWVLLLPAQQGLCDQLPWISRWHFKWVCSGCITYIPVTTFPPKTCRIEFWHYSSQWEFNFSHWRGKGLWSKIWCNLSNSVIALLSDIIFEQDELLWVNGRLNYCLLEIGNCFDKEKEEERERGKIHKKYEKCLFWWNMPNPFLHSEQFQRNKGACFQNADGIVLQVSRATNNFLVGSSRLTKICKAPRKKYKRHSVGRFGKKLCQPLKMRYGQFPRHWLFEHMTEHKFT